ncbi:Right handed beta helix region [uncultured archaeon]|nr:Right handed beta helix region [uncultured archaeon]
MGSNRPRSTALKALFFAFFLLTAAQAVTDIPSCPYQINSSGTYTLSANLTAINSTCINVSADNVLLDGASYTLTGDNSSAYGIYIPSTGYANITIQNINVQNFSNAIYAININGLRLLNSNFSTSHGLGNGGYQSFAVYLQRATNSLLDNVAAVSSTTEYTDNEQPAAMLLWCGDNVTVNNSNAAAYRHGYEITTHSCAETHGRFYICNSVANVTAGYAIVLAHGAYLVADNLSLYSYNGSAFQSFELPSTSINLTNSVLQNTVGGLTVASMGQSDGNYIANTSFLNGMVYEEATRNGLYFNDTFSAGAANIYAFDTWSFGWASIRTSNITLDSCRFNKQVIFEDGSANMSVRNSYLTANGSSALSFSGSTSSLGDPLATSDVDSVVANNTFVSASPSAALSFIGLNAYNNRTTIYLNNFTNTAGKYVNDLSNSSILTYDGKGNLYWNVANGSVNITGAAPAPEYPGFYYGTCSGSPYTSSSSQGKISTGLSDSAPLTQFLTPSICISSISISPASPYLNTTLTCSITVYDPISTGVTINSAWQKNGINYSTNSSPASNNTPFQAQFILNSSITSYGNTWSCSAIANDSSNSTGIRYSSNATVTSLPNDIISLLLNGNASNVSYAYSPGIVFNVSANSITGTQMIYQNGTPVGTTNYSAVLAAGYWNFTANSSGNGNYTAASASFFANISRSSASLRLNSLNWTVASGAQSNVTCTAGNSQTPIYLYRDGALIGSSIGGPVSDVDSLPDGTYAYTCNSTASQNYTAAAQAQNTLYIGGQFCGSAISTPGTNYTLSTNLVASPGLTCITVAAENVTIDCAGHSITGDGTSDGIYSNQNHTTVKNCIITNFVRAIVFLYNANGAIYNVTTQNDGDGVYFYESDYNNVSGWASRNGTSDSDLYLGFGSDYNNFTGFDLNSTGSAMGIWAEEGNANHNIFSYFNTTDIVANGLLSNYNIFSNGNITRNGIDLNGNYNSLSNLIVNTTSDSAINLGGGGIYNNISNSTLSSVSAPAISFATSNYNIISDSSATSGSREAIFIYESSYNTFSNVVASSTLSNAMTLDTDSSDAPSDYNTVIGSVLTSASSDAILFLNEGAPVDHNNFTGNSIRAPAGTAVYLKNAGSNLFLHNSIRGARWVNDSGSGNLYNDSSTGNTYYFANGTPSWHVYNISSSTNGIWADQGSDLPFNHTKLGIYWIGNGSDYHPYTKRSNGSDCNSTLSIPGTYFTLDIDLMAYPSSTCLAVAAENVTIDCAGHSITGDGTSDGIYSNQNHTTVKNCTIINFSNGINFDSATYGTDNIAYETAYNVTTRDNGYGIRLYGVSYGNISDWVSTNSTSDTSLYVGYGTEYSNFTNFSLDSTATSMGIWAEEGNANHNIFSDFSANVTGIAINIGNSNYNTFINGNVSSSASYAFYGAGDSYSIFSNLTMNSASGFYLEGSEYNNITDSTITSNNGMDSALFLFTSDPVAYPCSHNLISRVNATSENGVAISMTGAGYNTISDFTGNRITLDSSAGNVISNSTINAEGNGIFLQVSSSNNTISNNVVNSSGGDGCIVVSSGSNNTISNNTLACAGEYGLVSWDAGNVFLQNNITAPYWVDDEAAGNAFNDSSVGNIYYFANGTPSWQVYNIRSSKSGAFWTDAGNDLPFSNAKLGSYWPYEGEDWHPFTLNAPAPQPTPSPPAPSSNNGGGEVYIPPVRAQNTTQEQNTTQPQQNATNQSGTGSSVTRQEAEDAIKAAEAAITNALKESKDASDAIWKYSAARDAFGNEDYAKAKELADEAKQLAENAKMRTGAGNGSTPGQGQPLPPPDSTGAWGAGALLLLGGAVILVAFAVGSYAFLFRPKK